MKNKLILLLLICTFGANAQNFTCVTQGSLPTSDRLPWGFVAMEGNTYLADSLTRIYFGHQNDSNFSQPQRREIWSTRGTPNTTIQETNFNYPGSIVYTVGSFGNGIYFERNDPVGKPYFIFYKNGVATTKNFSFGLQMSSSSMAYIPGNHSILYRDYDNGSDPDLYVFHDTASGGRVLIPINTVNSAGSWPSSLTYDGIGKVYFSADDWNNGRELWVTDGTIGGTNLLKDINLVGNSFPKLFTPVGGLVYFVADNGAAGYELWKTDGTTNGTVLVKDINSGSSGSGITEMVAFNGKVYFDADDGVHGKELWVSDGTPAGTQMLKDIHTQTGFSSNPTNLTVIDTVICFSARNANNGYEPYYTNGTSTGTKSIKNIAQGSASSSPQNFTGYHGKVYFFATRINQPVTTELFESDLTSAGTKVIAPAIAPTVGPCNNATSMLVWKGELYFPANFDSKGSNMWKYTTPTPVAVTDLNIQVQLNVYPNPTKDKIVIETDEKINQIKLYDLNGRQLLEGTENQKYLDLTNLPFNLYFLEIQTEKGTVYKKIQKI